MLVMWDNYKSLCGGIMTSKKRMVKKGNTRYDSRNCCPALKKEAREEHVKK